ncbi:MAG: cyclodeaminase/cyclohydrolase family protein [Thermacetogeniaceae bacterium]
MLTDLSVEAFIDEVASSSPAPGGGSVSALAGALGAALVAMVARLTAGREGSGDDAQAILERAEKLLASLRERISEDTAAFNRVMEAYRLPKQTEEERQRRSRAIQEALLAAAQLPMSVAQDCLEVMRLCEWAVRNGNPNAFSDAAVALQIARSGLIGALYNVAINIEGLKDPEQRQLLAAKRKELQAEADQIAGSLEELIARRFG